MKTKTRFAWKQFLKNLAIIAIPVALQNMLTTTGSMIDTMMIAPLGETTVGAVGLCAQFSSLMFAGYWGFFGGGMGIMMLALYLARRLTLPPWLQLTNMGPNRRCCHSQPAVRWTGPGRLPQRRAFSS